MSISSFSYTFVLSRTKRCCYGLFVPGPYHVVEPIPAGQNPTLYQNPERWNQVANILYLEMPAGVGFSYADNPSGYNANDTSQAIDNWHAIQVFFKGFPELAANDFFISGESYAGASSLI